MSEFKIPIFKVGNYQSNLYYDYEFPNGIFPKDYHNLKKATTGCAYTNYMFARNRTSKECIRKMFFSQKSGSNKRGHPSPEYDLEWLFYWMKDQARFDSLFVTWIQGQFCKDLKPSIRRINSSFGYLKSNIELLDWKENNYKANCNKRSGNLGTPKPLKPVQMLDLSGTLIKDFRSQMEAERWLRSNGFDKASQVAVCNCCKGNQKTAYRKIWKYA